jgi:tetratricopeptide (TPR) repeat protein
MFRLLIAAAAALPLLLGAPASAQFQGLDLGGKKKKEKKDEPKKEEARKDKAAPPPADERPVSDDGVALPQKLDLSAPEPKKDEKKERKADRKSSPQPVPQNAAAVAAGKQKLEEVAALFKEEKYEQSALAAFDLLQDPALAPLHQEARFQMAKALYRVGLYHSALGQLSQVLSAGDADPFFKPALEWLFFVSHKTVNETVILDEIARYANVRFPEKFQNEFRYLLARYHLVRGRALDVVEQRQEADRSFGEVKRLVMLIPKDDPFYPRGRYLEALAWFRENTERGFENAVAAFKEVVRTTRPAPGKRADLAKIDQSLRELAFMQLARTHYGHRQNRSALYYYGKIERGSGPWLEALFESSWANYRIGQYEQALGNLVTLSSPFFRDEYFPEALILKAVIYYENCRYRESAVILDEFERIYQPVYTELDTLLQKDMEASAYYEVLSDVQRRNRKGITPTGTDLILERVLRLALSDKDLNKTNESILELEGEMDGLGQRGDAFKFSGLAKEMGEQLKAQRAVLIKKAGMMARGKLEAERVALKRLLNNGLRIKFETTGKEKEFLEASLSAEGNVDLVRAYKYSVAVADDQLYWPYEGEYWRDELGTYQYTLTKGCRDRARPSGKVE